MSNKSPGTPTGWKRPEDVMKLHRIKLKQKALNARLCGTSSSSNNVFTESLAQHKTIGINSLNPFRKFSSDSSLKNKIPIKRTHKDIEDEESKKEEETASDGSLFRRLGLKTLKSNFENLEQNDVGFQNVLSKISEKSESTVDIPVKGLDHVPIDWTLRSKMRFMSRKPFPWNQKLKTCEEASGITGFVRCLDNDSTSQQHQCSTLDTSPNAQFLQTCMYWQHPHLPWLQLFPRSRLKPTRDISSSSGSSTPCILSNDMKTALHKDWIKSFMSLFHLLRAKQCPYFYLISNSFTCLFRAAGISGHTELHAVLTPTTRGFRHLLRSEDIEFTMPLKNQYKSEQTSKRRKSCSSTVDPMLVPLEQTQMETFDEEDDDDDEDEEATENWLKEMGVANNEIRKIRNCQSDLKIDEEREIDRTPESLIYVEGTEAQALFNFLVNCKSCVSTTGHLAGVPPTLISPVAFHSGSLQYLQVKNSTVKVEGDVYHSIEVRGPILPHTIQYVCSLLEKSQESFSLTFASIESTKPFSKIKNEPTDSVSQHSSILTSPRRNTTSSIFEQQNLSDCGLRKSSISQFCNNNVVGSFDSLKFSNNSYRVL